MIIYSYIIDHWFDNATSPCRGLVQEPFHHGPGDGHCGYLSRAEDQGGFHGQVAICWIVVLIYSMYMI